MESLAAIVALLFLVAITSGPIAIGIARIRTQSFIRLFIKRIFHGIFITMGTFVGAQWILIPDLPIFPRLVGLSALCTCYIAARNEYFPNFKVLQRLGIKTGKASGHGPVIKWKLRGRSNGKDGHGPEGQH
ncbi:MAG: hypothetical protein KJS70_02515 [Actinomycetales bacterium]|nr:hypothetical protein [Actinomycetales bacterium]